MPKYVFRVWLLPNPPLGFEPETEVWRDIEIGGEHTLADFHEAIFEAFDRWETHGYEFLTHDEDGIVTRCYVDPRLYEGEPSWPPMPDEQIEQFIDRSVPDDVDEDVKDRFRDLRKNPPQERNAAETTIADVDPESLKSLLYTFDMGDNWEHHIELRDVGAEPPEEPRMVGKQGDAHGGY